MLLALHPHQYVHRGDPRELHEGARAGGGGRHGGRRDDVLLGVGAFRPSGHRVRAARVPVRLLRRARPPGQATQAERLSSSSRSTSRSSMARSATRSTSPRPS